ncbi:MAG: hypothetical protein U9R39_00425 [Campylobacterota bacterium]|nr:hypothetical protein [Campylobacterota bacterium]
MNREAFIIKLETYQRSSAPINVKEKAINRLKQEFYNTDFESKKEKILNDIYIGSSELKASELY